MPRNSTQHSPALEAQTWQAVDASQQGCLSAAATRKDPLCIRTRKMVASCL